MFFSRAQEIALEALPLLDPRGPAGKGRGVKDLAAASGVPAPFLAKILGRLVDRGLLRSRRGRTGGFVLGRPASRSLSPTSSSRWGRRATSRPPFPKRRRRRPASSRRCGATSSRASGRRASPTSRPPPRGPDARRTPDSGRMRAEVRMSHPVKDPVSWLYPPIEPYRTGMLKVSDVHELYFEESGNPKGKPVVFLHGGPGGGTDPKLRRFFHPDKYRIVRLRPARLRQVARRTRASRRTRRGTSSPTSRSCARTSAIDRWQVFGGSLGLDARARLRREAPGPRDRARPARHLPAAQEGDRLVLPGGRVDHLPRRVGAVPRAHPRGRARRPRHGVPQAPHAATTRRCGSRPRRSGAAGRARRPSSCPTPRSPATTRRTSSRSPSRASRPTTSRTRASSRSTASCCATPGKIRHIPGVIVQGRYDVVCPIFSAWALHRAWPEADLIISPDAGHSAFEPPNSRALVAATDKFA